MTSTETIGSSVYFMMPFNGPAAAVFMAALICSTVTAALVTSVISVTEPSETGTRKLPPVILPFNSGKIRVIALAAPV